MFCPSCGMEEIQSNQFCRSCGTDLRPVRTVIAMPDLLVPHPRMWLRAFVLAPLQELQPAWVSDAQLAPLLAQGVARSQSPDWAQPL